MREIKFRAWDKIWKKMYENVAEFDLFRGVSGLQIPNDGKGSHLEFMQFTGLHDKNGKEIYESDYLGVYCVFWDSGKYILQNISTGDIIDCNENTTYNREVTGNRYENPREHKAMASDL